MVASLSMTAQAAEPSTLTMACKGTVTDLRTPDAKPEPISMGIIANLTALACAPGSAARVALLINPASPAAEITMRDAEVAARALALQIQILRASTSREINAAFATFVNERPDAVFVGGDPFFNDRRIQLANVASYHRAPTTYSNRELAEAGGLMSYGTKPYRCVPSSRHLHWPHPQGGEAR